MEELDVIELLSPVGSWPAGTTGTIVILDEDRPDWMMVEIVSEEDGSTLDTIDVRPEQVKVVWVNATRSWVDPEQSSPEIRVSARTRAK